MKRRAHEIVVSLGNFRQLDLSKAHTRLSVQRTSRVHQASEPSFRRSGGGYLPPPAWDSGRTTLPLPVVSSSTRP